MLRTALEKQTLLVAFLGYLWELVGELLSTLFFVRWNRGLQPLFDLGNNRIADTGTYTSSS